MSPRAVLAGLSLGATMLVVAAPAVAQRTSFAPRASLGGFYTENVDFVGTGDASDSGIRLGLTLPVTRETRKGSLSFVYSPHFVQFDDFAELDHDGHRLALSLSQRPAPTSSFGLQLRYQQTQQQADAASSDAADLLLSRRTDRETVSLDLSYSGSLRGRWSWGVAAGFSAWSFDEISATDTGTVPDDLEDRTAARASLRVSRSVSRQTSVGLSLGFRRFDLDLSGEETSSSLSFVIRREIADRLSVGLSLGGFRSEGEAAQGPGGSSSASRSGFQGSLSLNRSFRYTTLNVLAGHSPSAGGARVGTSTNSFFGLSVAKSEGRSWGWGWSARYAARDPSAEEQPEVDSVSVGGNIQIRLHRVLGLNLQGSWVDQSGDPTAKASFFRAGLGLSWHPRGWEIEAWPGSEAGQGNRGER